MDRRISASKNLLSYVKETQRTQTEQAQALILKIQGYFILK